MHVRCKMCGAEMEIADGMTSWECECCETVQNVPGVQAAPEVPQVQPEVQEVPQVEPEAPQPEVPEAQEEPQVEPEAPQPEVQEAPEVPQQEVQEVPQPEVPEVPEVPQVQPEVPVKEEPAQEVPQPEVQEAPVPEEPAPEVPQPQPEVQEPPQPEKKKSPLGAIFFAMLLLAALAGGAVMGLREDLAGGIGRTVGDAVCGIFGVDAGGGGTEQPFQKTLTKFLKAYGAGDAEEAAKYCLEPCIGYMKQSIEMENEVCAGLEKGTTVIYRADRAEELDGDDIDDLVKELRTEYGYECDLEEAYRVRVLTEITKGKEKELLEDFLIFVKTDDGWFVWYSEET